MINSFETGARVSNEFERPVKNIQNLNFHTFSQQRVRVTTIHYGPKDLCFQTQKKRDESNDFPT